MYIRKLIYITVPNQDPLFITKNYYHRIEITLVVPQINNFPLIIEHTFTIFICFRLHCHT